MAWVDLPSRHPSGFVWIYDKAFDRERGLRWRAHHLDGFEQGLPGDQKDRREMLAHGIDAAAAPETGWRHFSFCDCGSCGDTPPQKRGRQPRIAVVGLFLIVAEGVFGVVRLAAFRSEGALGMEPNARGTSVWLVKWLPVVAIGLIPAILGYREAQAKDAVTQSGGEPPWRACCACRPR